MLGRFLAADEYLFFATQTIFSVCTEGEVTASDVEIADIAQSSLGNHLYNGVLEAKLDGSNTKCMVVNPDFVGVEYIISIYSEPEMTDNGVYISAADKSNEILEFVLSDINIPSFKDDITNYIAESGGTVDMMFIANFGFVVEFPETAVLSKTSSSSSSSKTSFSIFGTPQVFPLSALIVFVVFVILCCFGPFLYVSRVKKKSIRLTENNPRVGWPARCSSDSMNEACAPSNLVIPSADNSIKPSGFYDQRDSKEPSDASETRKKKITSALRLPGSKANNVNLTTRDRGFTVHEESDSDDDAKVSHTKSTKSVSFQVISIDSNRTVAEVRIASERRISYQSTSISSYKGLIKKLQVAGDQEIATPSAMNIEFGLMKSKYSEDNNAVTKRSSNPLYTGSAPLSKPQDSLERSISDSSISGSTNSWNGSSPTTASGGSHLALSDVDINGWSSSYNTEKYGEAFEEYTDDDEENSEKSDEEKTVKKYSSALEIELAGAISKRAEALKSINKLNNTSIRRSHMRSASSNLSSDISELDRTSSDNHSSKDIFASTSSSRSRPGLPRSTTSTRAIKLLFPKKRDSATQSWNSSFDYSEGDKNSLNISENSSYNGKKGSVARDSMNFSDDSSQCDSDNESLFSGENSVHAAKE